MKIDKSRFKDSRGKYIVQGLFLEDRYNTDLAVFTYSGEDKEYNGVVYPSLKRLYLEHSDPTEYDFATTYLYDWPHWKRLCANSIVSKHIEEWRDELRMKLKSEGILQMIQLATEKESYQAAKYLADCGFDVKERGRPSKKDIEAELKKRADQEAEFGSDIALLANYKDK